MFISLVTMFISFLVGRTKIPAYTYTPHKFRTKFFKNLIASDLSSNFLQFF